MGRDVSTETLNFNVPVTRENARALAQSGSRPSSRRFKDLEKGDYDPGRAAPRQPPRGIYEKEKEGGEGG